MFRKMFHVERFSATAVFCAGYKIGSIFEYENTDFDQHFAAFCGTKLQN